MRTSCSSFTFTGKAVLATEPAIASITAAGSDRSSRAADPSAVGVGEHEGAHLLGLLLGVLVLVLALAALAPSTGLLTAATRL
jgi:hypothetical protein